MRFRNLYASTSMLVKGRKSALQMPAAGTLLTSGVSDRQNPPGGSLTRA